MKLSPSVSPNTSRLEPALLRSVDRRGREGRRINASFPLYFPPPPLSNSHILPSTYVNLYSSSLTDICISLRDSHTRCLRSSRSGTPAALLLNYVIVGLHTGRVSFLRRGIFQAVFSQRHLASGMNPRVSPKTRPAPPANGKVGVSRSLNNGGGVIASHLKDGEGSRSKNYDPGHLDIVTRQLPLPSTVSEASSVHLNTSANSGAAKLAAKDSKTPKPVIAVHSLGGGQVTYSDAEVINVTSGKGDNVARDAATGLDRGNPKDFGNVREKTGTSRPTESPLRDKPRQVSAPHSNGFNYPSGTSSPDVREQKSNISTAASSGCKQSPAASRSQSFHAEAAAGHAGNKITRSRSLSREVSASSSPNSEFHHGRPTQDHLRSRVDKFALSLPSSTATFIDPPAEAAPSTAGAGISHVANISSSLSRPIINSPSGTKRDTGHVLSVRFADVGPICCEAQAAVSEKTAKTCDSTAARYLGHVLTAASAENIPGVDAAIRLCSNTTSKKIYIDTVKKPVSNRSDLIDTVKKPVWNRSDLSNPEIDNTRIESLMACTKGQVLGTENDPIGGFLNGRYQDSLSLAYLRKNGFQQIRAGSLQQLEPATSSPCHALPRHPDLYMAHGGAEAADRNSSSSNISPSGSFGSPSPLRVSDHLSPLTARSCNYIFSPLAQTSNSCSSVTSGGKITCSGHWSLTPSSSLSSTSSSLSKEAAVATPASSASPSTPVISHHLPRRARLPSGSCSDEPPFSLMLMSSSSSSSLLLPTSSPSSSPTATAAGAPSRSSTKAFPSRDPVLSANLSSPGSKPKLLAFNLSSGSDAPSTTYNNADHSNPKPFHPLTPTSVQDAVSLSLRSSLLTPSALSSSDVGSSISSSATSLSSGRQHHNLSLQHSLLFPFPPGESPTSSPSLSSKAVPDSRGSLASLIKKESIAASYQLEYCWFCGRPMPPFGARVTLHQALPTQWLFLTHHGPAVQNKHVAPVFDSILLMSLSGGEEHLEKLAELEKLLAQAQSEKVKLVEEQVRIRESEMLALQKNEVLERELQQVKLRE
ncbi:hypothetical protein RRG08_014857, partial [Elysia crispata]